MSIAGVMPTIFAWEHRHILWLVLEANKETRDATWLRISIGKRDAACYQREKLITPMFNRANSVPLDEYNNSYRLDWMCVPGTPEKKNPYRKGDGLAVTTALTVCGEMVKKLVARRAFRSNENPCAEKQYFGHGFHTMCIQSVPVGFLALEAGKPNEDRPVVYALRDANDQIHYVKSSKKNVAVENIMFYPHAKRLNYEEETRHRLVVAVSA
jgi:hypothetical protein